ncbi:hypothetical protein LLG46_13485 [bacterium]|nr:hypothetical protein [bacterium]
MVREIEMDILTPRRLMSKEDGREVLDLLCKTSPNLIPEKWGTYEPIRTPFDPADYGPALSDWGNVFLWKRRQPKTEGSVWSAWSVRKKTGSIMVTVDAAKADVAGLIRLLEMSAPGLTPHFAYIHMLTEQDIDIGRLNDTVGCLDPERQRYGLCVTGYQLEKYIPELYWVTVFGKPYVELFGLDRLLCAPAPVVREIGGGCVYIQLSDSIYDLENDYQSVNNTRLAVKKHLDSNAFFDPDAPKDHVYNVPALELEPLPDSAR